MLAGSSAAAAKSALLLICRALFVQPVLKSAVPCSVRLGPVPELAAVVPDVSSKRHQLAPGNTGGTACEYIWTSSIWPLKAIEELSMACPILSGPAFETLPGRTVGSNVSTETPSTHR